MVLLALRGELLMPSEKSIDGIPKRPKAREWWLFVDGSGEVVHAVKLGGKVYQPKDGDELVLVQEVDRE